jgi:hypothetical protein
MNRKNILDIIAAGKLASIPNVMKNIATNIPVIGPDLPPLP